LGIDQSHVNSALEISEDPFRCIPMGHAWVFDEAAEDPNDVGNVGLGSNSEVE